MSTPTLVDPLECFDMALATIDRHPTRSNPTTLTGEEPKAAVCLYTDEKDSDWHCFVGQMAVDTGWRCPGPDVRGTVDTDLAMNQEWPLSPATVDVLYRLQALADRATWGESPWSEMRPWVVRMREAYVVGGLDAILDVSIKARNSFGSDR